MSQETKRRTLKGRPGTRESGYPYRFQSFIDPYHSDHSRQTSISSSVRYSGQHAADVAAAFPTETGHPRHHPQSRSVAASVYAGIMVAPTTSDEPLPPLPTADRSRASFGHSPPLESAQPVSEFIPFSGPDHDDHHLNITTTPPDEDRFHENTSNQSHAASGTLVDSHSNDYFGPQGRTMYGQRTPPEQHHRQQGFLNVAPGQGYAGLAQAGSRLKHGRHASMSSTFTYRRVGEGGATEHKTGGVFFPDAAKLIDQPEADDWLHEVRSAEDLRVSYQMLTLRGCMNVGFLVVLALALLMLFAGWPVLAYVNKLTGNAIWGSHTSDKVTSQGPTWINVVDADGNVQRYTESPLRGLIDKDTPASAMTRMSVDGKRQMKLVFSDEFNEDGRTFFEGDDPYFTAVDLHYWGTEDYEWYTPLGATTQGGALRISFTEQPMNALNFKSAMLQTWNKLCIQGGHLEVSVTLPGDPAVSGYWPAVWTMANIGRAGYGATNEGMWPYNYDTCDVGTMPNQTYGENGTGGPLAAEMTGAYVQSYGPALSYQPGQKLSRCTCASSTDHPGPKHDDGSWMGRGASELDLLEATAGGAGGKGRNSMSLQTAPYNTGYNITPGYTTVYNARDSLNTYTGAAYQQAVSAMIETPQDAYQLGAGTFGTYGVEWVPHYRNLDPYIVWLTSGKPSWKLEAGALGPDNLTEIGQRLVPPEPMYIIFNLGMSRGFSPVDFDKIKFPGVMSIDYVRVYQDEDHVTLSCDGKYPVMPSVDYIKKHAEAYWNQNLTIWRGKREDGAYGKVFPGHAMKGECT